MSEKSSQTPNFNYTPPVCDYTDSDYQATFWDTGERRYEDAVEEIALKRLLPDSGYLLLELGAGAGRNTPRYTGYQRIVLLDYSRTQLEQARARLGDSNKYVFVTADAYRLPFVAGLFDGATMIRTIHHLSEAPKALAEVRRVMSEKGVFILEFANKRNLKSIIRYFLRKQNWNPFAEEPVEFVKLNFDFHPKYIRREVKKAGFKIEKQLAVSRFRAGWLKKHIKHETLVKMDAALQGLASVSQYTPSVFSRLRAEGFSPKPAQSEFFACPVCGCALPEAKSTQTCPSCGHVWEYKDGIYEFRINPS